MACDAGKTFTSLRIAEKIAGAPGRVLDQVPTLALMSQTVREWALDAEVKLRALAASSDAQVGQWKRRNGDMIDMDSLDLALPATRDCHRIVAEVLLPAPGKMKVVFATYRWPPVIEAGPRQNGLPTFELAICDQAHRTARARSLGIARDHMGPDLFSVEIPGTRLGPTLRSDLLRTAPFAGLGVAHVNS